MQSDRSPFLFLLLLLLLEKRGHREAEQTKPTPCTPVQTITEGSSSGLRFGKKRSSPPQLFYPDPMLCIFDLEFPSCDTLSKVAVSLLFVKSVSSCLFSFSPLFFCMAVYKTWWQNIRKERTKRETPTCKCLVPFCWSCLFVCSLCESCCSFHHITGEWCFIEDVLISETCHYWQIILPRKKSQLTNQYCLIKAGETIWNPENLKSIKAIWKFLRGCLYQTSILHHSNQVCY